MRELLIPWTLVWLAVLVAVYYREKSEMYFDLWQRAAWKNVDPRKVLADIRGVPSTVEDAKRAREWRERRALSSPDHTRLHFVDAVIDSEAATEIMQFCVGGYETTEE